MVPREGWQLLEGFVHPPMLWWSRISSPHQIHFGASDLIGPLTVTNPSFQGSFLYTPPQAHLDLFPAGPPLFWFRGRADVFQPAGWLDKVAAVPWESVFLQSSMLAAAVGWCWTAEWWDHRVVWPASGEWAGSWAWVCGGGGGYIFFHFGHGGLCRWRWAHSFWGAGRRLHGSVVGPTSTYVKAYANIVSIGVCSKVGIWDPNCHSN